ncbi:MAG: helix-turn-helix domain-containing protein [Betaproteobacteria bacterium]
MTSVSCVNHEPEWLLPSEVAAKFRVSRQHVYRLIRRGDLAAVWVGGTPRIHRDELARFVAEGGRRPGQEDLEDLPAFRRRRTAARRR